jgi:DNA modification methylase
MRETGTVLTVDGIAVHCAHTHLRAVAELKPNPRNPNTHPEPQIKLLAKIIRAQGWRNAIVVSDRSGLIVKGHGRLMAAKLAGLNEAPVDVQHYDSDESEMEDMLADNRLAELAEPDDALTVELIKSLEAAGRDLDLTGIDADTLAELLGRSVTALDGEDDIPETPVDPITKPGDLWILGDHRVLCGDSTKPEDVARVMAGAKADIMATDPPYGVAYGVETGVGSKFKAIDNDENDGEKLQSFLEMCFRIAPLKDNAAWYLWHAQMTQGFFAAAAAAAAAAVIIHRQIIWVKPSLVLGHGDYHWRHELCFYGWKEGHRPKWFGDRKQTTVWEIGRENDHIHPTQKPVEIFERPLLFNTKAGDIAYEPFAGSGSQFIACEKLGRKCYGIEISPAYCDVIVKRWEDFTGKKAERDAD